MVTSFLLFAFYLYFVSCFYYLRYTRKNTPSDRFCTSCLRGFSNRCFIINHRCDRKKGRNGRYCCRTCLYETERRVKITKHSDKCSTKKLNIHLIEKVMTSKNTPLVQLCPFAEKDLIGVQIEIFISNDVKKMMIEKGWKRNNGHAENVISLFYFNLVHTSMLNQYMEVCRLKEKREEKR